MQAQVCWQCGSMLHTGTMVCPVCGVQQRSQAAPVDMQGAYPGYARQMQPAAPQPVGQQPAQQMVPQPSAPPMSYGVSNTDSAPPSSGRSAQRIASMYALGDAFVGSPASVGKRMLSLLIDLVVIAGVGVGAWLLSSSWILGVVAGLEVAIIFTVTQARTGASLGKLVTRTRVSRADSPQSPGLVRAAVRSAITGAGALLAAVGAFIVELTAAADSSGKRRTIADRAARTVVVSIPTEQARIEAEEVAQEAAHSEYLATLSGSGMELAGGVVSGGVAAESPMMGVRSAELGSGQSGVAAGAGVALSSGVPGAAVPGAGGAGGAGVPGGAAAPGASGAGVAGVPGASARGVGIPGAGVGAGMPGAGAPSSGVPGLGRSGAEIEDAPGPRRSSGGASPADADLDSVGPRRTSAAVGDESDRAPGPRRRRTAAGVDEPQPAVASAAEQSAVPPKSGRAAPVTPSAPADGRPASQSPAVVPVTPVTPAIPDAPATSVDPAGQPVVPSAPAAQSVAPAAPTAQPVVPVAAAAPVGQPMVPVAAAAPVGQPMVPTPAEQPRRRSSGQTVLTFDTGQREVVAANSIVALGRAPSATGGEDQLIVVTDSSTTISKNHARWEEDRGGVWVTDLGSTNGTELMYADGRTQVLTPGVRTSAQGVARIRLGDRTFTMSPLNGGSA